MADTDYDMENLPLCCDRLTVGQLLPHFGLMPLKATLPFYSILPLLFIVVHLNIVCLFSVCGVWHYHYVSYTAQ